MEKYDYSKMTAAELIEMSKIVKPAKDLPEWKRHLFNHGIHISTDLTSKMKNVYSISTLCLCNKDCLRRQNTPGCICENCFAAATANQYDRTAELLAMTTATLCYSLVPVDVWERLPKREIFRIESFGDLQSVTQAENYLNMVIANPETMFAWWTKNPIYIARALKEMRIRKPKNLVVVFSSMFKNKSVDLEAMQKVFPFIDKIFTVYTPEYLEAHKDINVNCGARSCNTCRRCYKKNTAKYINELLK